MCVCADPDTPISTPDGERPISEIAVGDWVYSVERDQLVVVPVVRINRAPVEHHRVVRVSLASGRSLEVSAPHPTADGRTFGELRVGDTLDDVAVTGIELIPYAHPFTYDILPSTQTGIYFAAGVAIGSSLR
jgi:hypothetical protein